MARPLKEGLDYYPRKVGIFNDPKVERLIANCGWIGYGVWDYLLDRIYDNGYFYNWPSDEPEMIALKMSAGVTCGLVRDVVSMCCNVGLFNKEVLSVYKVLTSPGIQRRYCMAASERKNKKVIAEYWLLENSESSGFIKCALKNSLSENNHSLSDNNHSLYPEKLHKVKESKVKDIREDKSSLVDDSADADPPQENKSKKKFDDDSPEMKLSLLLSKKMRKNNKNCKLPGNYNEWCKHFDLMIRRDGRTPKEIQDMIVFSQNDTFWASNILSAKTLRKKYDQLFLKSKGNNCQNKNSKPDCLDVARDLIEKLESEGR